MKVTQEEYLKLFGVEIGNIVKVQNYTLKVAKSKSGGLALVGKDEFGNIGLSFEKLVEREYKVIRVTNVGDLPFTLHNCKKHNVQILYSLMNGHKTIYNALEFFKKTYEDEELYKVLKERCDVEISLNELGY